MSLQQTNLTIVSRPARVISDGLIVSRDAYLSIKHGVRQRFVEELSEYMRLGLVEIRTARLKPKGSEP